MVATYPAMRAERWYAAWRPTRKVEGTTLVRRQPRSAVLLFEDAATHRKKYEKYLGRDTLALLEAPDRIEALAVHPWPAARPPPGHAHDPAPQLPPGTPTTIFYRPVYAVGRPLTAEFARRLAAVLLDDATYVPDMPPFGNRIFKMCVIWPGVAYRVWSGRRSVDLLFCFDCDQVEVVRDMGPHGQTDADIDNGRAAFVRLAKEALPAVPEITALPEVHPNRFAPTR
jgi:hypothetical protein